jgi:hypothetical protein
MDPLHQSIKFDCVLLPVQGALDLLPANASKAQVLSIIQRQITGASDSDSDSSEESDEESSDEEDDVIVLD